MPASQPLPPWSPADLPTGTVTLLFTDIEGSTRLGQRLGDTRYRTLLEEHRRILRAALDEHGGREFGTEGDALFSVFVSASQAVAAAAAAQRGLGAHSWPDEGRISVRMGLHTGEVAREGDGGYVGIALHRVARIAAAGHGGQVLLSRATRAVAAETLPAGIGVRDLGEHHLKDFDAPSPSASSRQRGSKRTSRRCVPSTRPPTTCRASSRPSSAVARRLRRRAVCSSARGC